ncbi:MAG: response regulator transcription factor [Dehalococcoidia bacterium]
MSDNYLTRLGIKSLLKGETEVAITGEATSASEALASINGSTPDVVLLDIHRPGNKGIGATCEIIEAFPESKVLVLTALENSSRLAQIIRAGAGGYLVYRQISPETLISALTAVSAGELYGEPGPAVPSVAGRVEVSSSLIKRKSLKRVNKLTSREEEVLELISEGKENSEIARTLNIVESTVKNHINSIYTKLNIKNRYQAIKLKLNKIDLITELDT